MKEGAFTPAPQEIQKPTPEKSQADVVGLPQADKTTGIYTDKEGKKWGTVETIADLLKTISKTTLSTKIEGIKSIKGKYSSGKEVVLYDIATARERMADYSKLPQVDKITGIYTDAKSKEWTTINKLTELLNVGERKISKNLTGVKNIRGKDMVAKEVILYDLADIKKKLADFIKLPQVDEKTGVYVDERGVEWTTVDKMSKTLNMSNYKVSADLSEIKNIKGRGSNGKETTLYDFSVLKEKLADFIKLPQVDETTGIYTDKEDVKWISVNELAKFLEQKQTGGI